MLQRGIMFPGRVGFWHSLAKPNMNQHIYASLTNSTCCARQGVVFHRHSSSTHYSGTPRAYPMAETTTGSLSTCLVPTATCVLNRRQRCNKTDNPQSPCACVMDMVIACGGTVQVCTDEPNVLKFHW